MDDHSKPMSGDGPDTDLDPLPSVEEFLTGEVCHVPQWHIHGLDPHMIHSSECTDSLPDKPPLTKSGYGKVNKITDDSSIEECTAVVRTLGKDLIGIVQSTRLKLAGKSHVEEGVEIEEAVEFNTKAQEEKDTADKACETEPDHVQFFPWLLQCEPRAPSDLESDSGKGTIGDFEEFTKEQSTETAHATEEQDSQEVLIHIASAELLDTGSTSELKIKQSMTRRKEPLGSSGSIMEDINKNCVVPINNVSVPEYCFEMTTDFTLNRRDTAFKKQLGIIGIILTAMLNTSGGVLTLFGLCNIASHLLDIWRHSLQDQFQCIPKWITRLCMSMPIMYNRNIAIFVKKSPRLITYNSHIFVRSPAAVTQLADTETITSLMLQSESDQHAMTTYDEYFTSKNTFMYGEKLPEESMFVEYKYWRNTSVSELIHRFRQERIWKGLFALSNNHNGGFLVAGIEYRHCTVCGLYLSRADFQIFREWLAEWMVKDDDGNARIWENPSCVPKEGVNWDIRFVPVTQSPFDQKLYVIIIHMKYCSGGMFVKTPECYLVEYNGLITQLSFDEWKQKILVESNSKCKDPVMPENNQVSPIGTVKKQMNKSETGKKSEDSNLSADKSNYQSASWSQCGDWTKYMHQDDHDINISHDTKTQLLQMTSPLNMVPAYEQLQSIYDASCVECLFEIVHREFGYSPGVAVTLSSWAHIISPSLETRAPPGHMFDTLIISLEAPPKLLSSFDSGTSSDTTFDTLSKERQQYCIKLCRLLAKQIMTAPLEKTLYSAIQVHIEPYIYVNGMDNLQSATDSQDVDMFSEWYKMSHLAIEGLTIEDIHKHLITILTENVVWMKNMLGEAITYQLTRHQGEAIISLVNNPIVLIEGPPGSGKTVMATFMCERYCKMYTKSNVLYVCPSKAMARFIEYQGYADTFLVRNDDDITELCKILRSTTYKIVTIDDVQAMTCSYDAWYTLLSTVYGVMKLLLLQDSRYQDYRGTNSCKALQMSLNTFSSEHSIAAPSILRLTENLRNSLKVFSFLKAQIGTTATDVVTCGHNVDGDDVSIRVVTNPWEDSPDNELIKLVNELIMHRDNLYRPSDICLLIDDTNEEVANKMREIFWKHSNIPAQPISTLPWIGVCIGLMDDFMGLEAQICIVLANKESLRKTQYRTFMASRAVTRLEIICSEHFSTDIAKTLALTDLGNAERESNPRLLWDFAVSSTTDVGFLSTNSGILMIYIHKRHIEALSLAGENVSDNIPEPWTLRDSQLVSVSAGGRWGIICRHPNEQSYSITTLKQQSGIWYTHPTYAVDGVLNCITISDEGEAIAALPEMLIKFNQHGLWMWQIEKQYSLASAVHVTRRGTIYVAEYYENTISVYTPDGLLTHTIDIAKPAGICSSSSGYRLLVAHQDKIEEADSDTKHCISLISQDGSYRRRLCQLSGLVHALALHQDKHMAIAMNKKFFLMYDIRGVI